jgi:hypothetical protein
MTHTVGQLVNNKKFGLGKVVAVNGDSVTVFFKSQSENPRTIKVSVVPLEVPENQSDLWLDNLDLTAAIEGTAKRKYVTHEQAVEVFLGEFPKGFYDPAYIGDSRKGERHYKLVAHELWCQTLNKQAFEKLLDQRDWTEITQRTLRVEGKTNLLASFEKAALREAVDLSDDAARFSEGLYDLIYGEDNFEHRFGKFAETLDRLPQPKTPLRWTVQTIFPFLAMPKEHMFLKPGVTQEAAERRQFSLNYLPQPNWLTYSCLLKFAEALMKDLAHLKPRDMIDIQSFIYVTGEGSYQ